ncbi:MAG: HAD family phosphatase [Rhodoluna sp.]|nr:HAD family phosphatase [Rhodoluna sp.]
MLFNRLPKAVLWDMDGTLIDSEPHWLHSERELARAHDFDWTEEDSKSMVGLSLSESSRIFREKTGTRLSHEEIINHLTASVSAGLEREIIWRPGAKELLKELRRKGVKTALVTMSLRSMALQVVDAMGFKAFDVVVAGDDVVHGKPHAEPYLKAAALLGEDPADCVAFEDSISGILSAEAAGTKAVGIPNVMIIPAREGRILWETLEGKSIKDLRKLFA